MRLIFTLLFWGLCATCSQAIAQTLSCTPQPIQNACNSQDIDQSGSTETLLPRSALNPIDLFSGNKYLRDVDWYPHPAAPELEVVRHYNSMSSHYGITGGSWRLSYDAQLIIRGSLIQLHQANGSLRELQPRHGHLETLIDRWIWHFSNGDKWHFNRAGWLIQIHRLHQPILRIERYTQGPLLHRPKQISQNNHSLHLHYSSEDVQPILLSHIQTPNGVIQYHYNVTTGSDLPQLQHIEYPDQRRLYYHYEPSYQSGNHWAITGKSIQQHASALQHRVRSWVYDRQGRAIFIMADSEQWVRLQYPSAEHPLQTRLQSTNGFTYITFSADAERSIQSVHGASCWACPPTFTRQADRISFAHFSLQHDAQQQIKKISGQFPGWPDLELSYNSHGQLTQWKNAAQHPTTLFYDLAGRASQITHPNGDQQRVSYNSQQQVVNIEYSNQTELITTRLHRPSPLHLHVSHPTEDEQLAFNSVGKLLERKVQRHLQTPTGEIHWHYAEQFSYDEQHRVVRHDLPEGGALLYVWQNQQLKTIEWENKAGIRQLVVEQQPHAYHYGNGLTQHYVFSPKKIQQQLQSNHTIWWQQHLHRQAGLITTRLNRYPLLDKKTQSERYVYNAQKQLIMEQSTGKIPRFYAWHQTGELAAHNQQALPQLTRDLSGLVQQLSKKPHNYMLRYNAMRRLDVVYNDKKTVQKNSHNAYGFRVYAQHYPQATQQFFLYHNKKIVAEYTTPLSAKLPIHAAHPISKRYIYLHNQPVGLIDYQSTSQGELLVMHSDHLGAVHMISDAQQQLRWAAQYDAFGMATLLKEDMEFHLRREGQYYDIATGWHDNLLRIYLPEQGQYLEPDPLGPNPTTQLFGYAEQQPLNHTDPWGLILFAFDGTRYDESSGGVVYLLHKAAKDDSFYVAGPGNPDSIDLDAAISYTTDQIVQQQWTNLIYYLHYAQANTPTAIIPIDIIAFSRGAAIALHFANQIIAHTNKGLFSYTDRYGDQVKACIQPRFMGLLDNVAQMGILGAKNHLYDFSVSPAWQWVVHGVAMHESRYLFPLYSIGSANNSLETGFIGAHGDLGGGYPIENEPNTKPLSDVALEWILWNARAQGMQFNHIDLKQGNYAYMHDESLGIMGDRLVENYPFPFTSDRDLRNKQTLHPIYGQKARTQVRPAIDYALTPDEQKHNRSGKVDLEAYYRWLDQTLHWRPD
ncbi:RHS repeat-associated core domain-containing protein [Paenalcaligenes faecalis]|uniref:RHS repeat-associated core domain-containing protein n=1 Tax=Paenalcaligenes faecalis TaxID=2980099 RepID=UPI0022B98868|nr:RHS repeat-associated core domain-containing protein [Paenalcaligenes faecalis]